MPEIFVNNTFTSVKADYDVHKIIYRLLSYKIKNWESIRRRQLYKNPKSQYWQSWDGTKSAYDFKSRKFMTGLLPNVLEAAAKNGIHFNIMDSRNMLPAPSIPSQIKLADDEMGFITLRDYQMRVANNFFDVGNGRGIAKLATGAGKTEGAIGLTKIIDQPTLFLTHRVNLLNQTAKRFAMRIPKKARHIGLVGNGQHNIKHITIATVQTLQRMIKRDLEYTAKLLSNFRFLITDEAHRSGASQFYDPANLCINACFRLALTATPFMQGNAQDDLILMGVSGPIFCSVSNGELIKRGLMAKPYFAFIEINAPKNMGWIKNWHDIYDHGIVDNVQRNSVITKQAAKLLKMGRRNLTIVERVPHGKTLETMMKSQGLKPKFVSGKAKVSTREKALSDLARGRLDLIISTNIFDEGIDVKEIDAMINAAGGKNPVSLFQRVGRTTRKKKTDNYAIIVDFIDKQHPTLYAHSRDRYNMVKNEEGFVIL